MLDQAPVYLKPQVFCLVSLLAMLTRTFPLVSVAVSVPWIVSHHCAIMKVGGEHKHIVKDPLHHVLSLLLAARVKGGHARSRLHPGIVFWVVGEVPVQILATLKLKNPIRFNCISEIAHVLPTVYLPVTPEHCLYLELA